MAEFLEARGIPCGKYVGGGDPDEVAAKESDLNQFLSNDLRCIVATSALGMGYDKPDVGWVVHFQMPQSAIAYYQQVGRPDGPRPQLRDSSLASRIAYPGLVHQAGIPIGCRRGVHSERTRAGSDDGLTRSEIAQRTNLTPTRLDGFMVQLQVEGVVEKEGSRWRRTLAPWTYPHERVTAVNEWRRAEQAAMGRYLEGDECRMAFLRRQLDDLPAEKCEICDVCRNERFGVEPSPDLVHEASESLLKAYVPIEPRKQWPAGTPWAGTIPQAKRTQVGWCLTRMAHSVGAAHSAGEAAGSQIQRRTPRSNGGNDSHHGRPPTGMAHLVPSERLPQLVPDFARRLAARLGIPALDLVAKTRTNEPQKMMHNSAWQHRNVHNTFAITDTPPESSGLLLDDIIDSRWTTTVIGHQLLNAGAGPVVPIGLASAAGSG